MLPGPVGWVEGVEEAGAAGKGVLRVGEPPKNGCDRASPVFGQISKRVVKLRKTFEPLTVPRDSRFVLLAPRPLSIDRYEYDKLDESHEVIEYCKPAEA